VLAPPQGDGVNGVAMDATAVYFARAQNGIMRCLLPTCAGGPTVFWSGSNQMTTGVAIDEVNVYWTNSQNGGAPVSGSVMTCPKTGCGAGPTVLATGQNWPTSIAVWNGTAYWRNNDSIRSCPRGGCSQNPTTLGVISGSGMSGVNLLAAAGHGIYWPSPQNMRALCRCLTPPCDVCPNQIPISMGGIMALAADEEAVYCLDQQRLYRWAP
jgi:hypothetical protein